MSSVVWLSLTVILVVVIVLSGGAPRGGKPVARTGLMRTARGFLILGIVVCGAVGVWGALHR